MGGLGPEATVDFMARVLALTPAEKDQDHIHLLVDQNPGVPNRQDAILRGATDPAPALAAMAKRDGAALVLIGHVTKDGSIAGPRVLEHLVDVVLAVFGLAPVSAGAVA